MTTENLDIDLLSAAVARLPQGKLDEVRRSALASFRTNGWPTTRDEAWRYTNLAPIAALSNRWLRQDGHAEHTPQTNAAHDVVTAIEAQWLVIRDGELDAESYEAAAAEFGDQLHIERAAISDTPPDLFLGDALSSLNASLLRDALIVRVPTGVTLERPIGILHIDHATSKQLSTQARVVLHLASGAAANFIEVRSSTGGAEHVANTVTEVHVAAGAHAQLLDLQQRDARHMTLHTSVVRLERGAQFDSTSFQLGSQLARVSTALIFDDAQAHAAATGLAITSDAQHVDNRVFADHAQPNCTSQQNFRGIAGGRSRSIFNGKALVRKGADGTDAEQSSHNLLLSEDAEIDTKPELEIYADDVKCSHGATVGQLDEDALFYLRARGFSRDQAARTLTRAFANRVVEDIPIAAARAYAERLIDDKLLSLVGARNT